MSANGSTRSTLAPNGATEFYSLLQKLEDESIKIDMDSIDPDIANGMPFKPHNREWTRTPADTGCHIQLHAV